MIGESDIFAGSLNPSFKNNIDSLYTWKQEQIIHALYQWRIQNNIMKGGCTKRGFEIYDYLMSFDMNDIKENKPCATVATASA
jgi:hypothetical protein